MHAFNNLSRYAPEFVNTKEKKIESFKCGLGTKLMKTMANSRCATYNEFVSDALTQENQNNLHMAAKGHKRAFEAGASVHLQRKLLWQRGLNFVPLHLSSGLPRRRYNPTSSKKCITRPSPLPYPRECRARKLSRAKKQPAVLQLQLDGSLV